MLRFDHLVIAVRDLEWASDEFRLLGFDVRPGGRHEGFGTHNAIVRFGLDYLELIAVEDEHQALQTSRGALVRFLAEQKIGLCAFALATDDLDSLSESARSAGLTNDPLFAMTRKRPDGSMLSWRLFVPGGDQYFKIWPFFIEWDQPDAERLATEQPGLHPNGSIGVTRIEIGASDVEAATAWYKAMQIDPARFGGSLSHIAPGQPEAPRSVAVRVNDLEATRAWLIERGLHPELSTSHPDTLRIADGPLPGALLFTSI